MNRELFSLMVLAAVLFPDPAPAQVLFRDWHLTMTDVHTRSRVALVRGERRNDAQGSIHVQGTLAVREGSQRQPEEIFFDMDLTTTLLRNTDYDPEILRSSIAAGYRRRRKDYMIDVYGEHVRRMNTDTVARRNANFFGVALADPEFDLRRFGTQSRTHAKVAAGSLVNENGFKGSARYLVALRYDLYTFHGRQGRLRLPKGQIFLEGEADAIDMPGGLMTDLEVGFRFLFFPDADNSLSLSAKFYDSKNPFGHGDDGVRVDLDLDGSHTGELFKLFLGNTAGEVSMGVRGEDVATELEADFDLVRVTRRARDYVIVFDTLQRATWGKLNKVEYNLQGGVETIADEKVPYIGRHIDGMTAGLYVDHRSTHGLDRDLKEQSYNLVRLAVKSQGWDRGRENETQKQMAILLSVGGYAENTFKKARDFDARAGIRLDGKSRPWGTWTLVPYLMATVRNATNQGGTVEQTGELGLRFNGNAVFARWSQDAYFGEGGLGGLALRF